uniref:Uncharacterized protein n=1 Tax=Solanum lycopersicum TaxID=4081 RepID=A0A3Q7IQ30_SOLLC
MSTDLQFPQDLFEMNSPNINSSQRCINSNINIIISNKDDCKTPKSSPFLIPKILKCPAAPKKPRRVISSCKRKLQFVEIVASKEVESFFKILDDDVVASSSKKI